MRFFRKKKQEQRNYTAAQLEYSYDRAHKIRLEHTQLLEASALLWANALSSARPQTADYDLSQVLTPEVLSDIGFRLILTGEAVFWYDKEVLHPVSDYTLRGTYNRDSWQYDLTLSGPSRSHRVSSVGIDSVLHVRWRRSSSGEAIAPAAQLSRRIDEMINQELSSGSGYLLPLPKNPNDHQHTILRETIRNLKGRSTLIETQRAGMDSGDVRGGEWKQIRLGADLPGSITTLRASLVRETALVTGVPEDLIKAGPGTSQREALRRFVGVSVTAILNQIAAEASRVITDSKVFFSVADLWASDFVGRTNAAKTLIDLYAATKDSFFLDKARESVSI